MNSRRITEITFEATESVTIWRAAGSVRTVCTECEPAEEMVTLDEAFVLSRIGARALFREIESGRLHFHEIGSGSIVICLHSLERAVQQTSSNPKLSTNPNKEISS